MMAARLPQGEPFPFDLSPLVSAAVCAGQSRRELLEVTAQRWNLPRERVRQLGLRVLQQLTVHTRVQGWAGQLCELTQTPRAVVIPQEIGGPARVVRPVRVEAGWFLDG